MNITSNFKINYRQTTFFPVIDKVLAEYENKQIYFKFKIPKQSGRF